MENVSESVNGMNEWQRIVGIFTAPSRVFEDIRRKPTAMVGIVILCIVTGLAMIYPLTSVIIPWQAESTREGLIEEGRSAEEIEVMMRYAAGPIAVVFGTLASLLTPLLSVLFRSAIHSLILVMTGVMSNFKQVMAMNTRVYFIGLLGMLIKIPMWIRTESMRVDLGLAAFLPDNVEMTSRLYRLFANFEVFVVWQVVLTAIGISCMLGISNKKAALIAVLAWLVMVAISLAAPESCAQRM
jgi:hypothetical protein